MKKILFLVLAGLMMHESQAQTCASAYDNAFNNSNTPTHYFPGPFAIPLNTDINGRIEVASDIDYYKFYITTGGTISLTLRNLPANYNLNLVNSNGITIATSARSGTSSETINYTATSNTEYFALVYPANNKTFNSRSCYTLRVSTLTASRLSGNTQFNTGVYPNPVRNFTNLQLDAFEGMAQIRVMNLAGALVLQQNTNRQTVQLDLGNLPSGMYFINAIDNEGKTIYRGKLTKE